MENQQHYKEKEPELSLGLLHKEVKIDLSKADNYQIDGTHYKDMPVEPWELMTVVLTHEEFKGYMKGCAIKYAMRAGHKVGATPEKDAGKFYHYKHKLHEINND